MASEQPTTSPTASTPSEDELLALLDCFRYGDLEEGDFDDIKRFTEQYGDRWLAEAKDDRGNTPLHMAGGNGHLGECERIPRFEWGSSASRAYGRAEDAWELCLYLTGT
jgi:hypothetical protein